MRKRNSALQKARNWERLASKYRRKGRKHVARKYARKAALLRGEFGYAAREAYVAMRVGEALLAAWNRMQTAIVTTAERLQRHIDAKGIREPERQHGILVDVFEE